MRSEIESLAGSMFERIEEIRDAVRMGMIEGARLARLGASEEEMEAELAEFWGRKAMISVRASHWPFEEIAGAWYRFEEGVRFGFFGVSMMF